MPRSLTSPQYKGETGLDEDAARSWRSWHHHTALALVSGAFLLQVQQGWGEKEAGLTLPQVTRVLRVLLPQREGTPAALCGLLGRTQAANDTAKRAHLRRRERRKPSL